VMLLFHSQNYPPEYHEENYFLIRRYSQFQKYCFDMLLF